MNELFYFVVQRFLVVLLAFLGSLNLTFAQGLSRPEAVTSFGANGTHWPSKVPTPFMYDENVVHKIEVDTSWEAISTAIESVTDEMANEGVLILVRPGELAGEGIGGNDKVVLDGVGSLLWTKRVTICPRDGYGTVQMTPSSISEIKNICIAGFDCEGGIRFSGCQQSALAWMSFDSGWLGTQGKQGVVSRDNEFVEVVVQHGTISYADTTQIAAGGEVIDWTWEGCYFPPNNMQLPLPEPRPHSDTLQFFGVSYYGGVVFKDCVVFAADNTAIQTGGLMDYF